jgi:hypothetical protein
MKNKIDEINPITELKFVSELNEQQLIFISQKDTWSYNQFEIIENITLYTGDIELDATYSKGNFYKNKEFEIKEPKYKFDLYPQGNDVIKANANNLPIANEQISTIMFDPPFLVGYTKKEPTGIMGKRFHGFRNINEMWQCYEECLAEFYRILKPKGYLIFKCQDTVSGGKQWWSENHIIMEADKIGFSCIDITLLFAKHRMIGHNHQKQKHARKFHSYFVVFQK